MPIPYAPPWIHTMTGSRAPGSAAHTLTVSQSSASRTSASMPKKPACGGGGPNSVASRTPSQGVTGRGASKRSGPTGGSANGMPRKTARPASLVPRTLPAAVRTSVVITARILPRTARRAPSINRARSAAGATHAVPEQVDEGLGPVAPVAARVEVEQAAEPDEHGLRLHVGADGAGLDVGGQQGGHGDDHGLVGRARDVFVGARGAAQRGGEAALGHHVPGQVVGGPPPEALLGGPPAQQLGDDVDQVLPLPPVNGQDERLRGREVPVDGAAAAP